jgi:hypothetical protein
LLRNTRLETRRAKVFFFAFFLLAGRVGRAGAREALLVARDLALRPAFAFRAALLAGFEDLLTMIYL